jgi:excisionase family DNA binding protein
MADALLIQISKDELKALIQEAVKDVVKERQPVKVVQPDADPLLKIGEICKILQVSKVTIHQWKKQGKIPFHRISNRIFFKRSEILESLKTINTTKK